ncbi:MAG: cupredoxin domain-containing protein [Proteobacteria bacterium]|nr:cupredoxin domain-containing protein [Pseudomonadota bacterium]
MTVRIERRAVLSGAAAVITVAALGLQTGKPTKGADRSPRKHVVEIKNFAFVPSNLNVKIGDVITWINRDIAPHTATTTDRSWDSGTIKKDKSHRVAVTAEMAGSYFCRFHPHMRATLEVSAIPH